MSTTTRLFFATDIHASTRCFKKFLNAGAYYGASVLVLGGDVTGKRLFPLEDVGRGRWQVHGSDQHDVLSSEESLLAFEARAADAGAYTSRCSPEQLALLQTDATVRATLFKELILARMRDWVDLADQRLAHSAIKVFFNAGNDDLFEIDPVIDSSAVLVRPEGKCVSLPSSWTMVSTGFANRTPFACPRDITEDALSTKLSALARLVPDMARCVFNFHCPPYQSQLDNAPALDDTLRPRMSPLGVEYAPAGSVAVRKAIELHQPPLALHGHIHESRGAILLGRTRCINPGSEYHEGLLCGALIDLGDGRVNAYTLTCG